MTKKKGKKGKKGYAKRTGKPIGKRKRFEKGS